MSRLDEAAHLLDLQAGTRKYFQVPVTVELGGYEVFLPVHVIRGSAEGPTVALLSTLHGIEWTSIEIIRRILDRVAPNILRGNIVAVPVGNPVALTHLTRPTPDDSDAADVNRAFGGRSNWLSELLARKLAEVVFPRTDYLIDYHTHGWGSAFGMVLYFNDFADASMNRRVADFARAFGYPSLSPIPAIPGTSIEAAGRMGIPGIAVEIGGAGWDRVTEERWLESNVRGAFNVFYRYGMLPGEAEPPGRYLIHGKRRRVNPAVGGYLHSRTGPERLLGEVEEGEELGRVLSTATLEELEVITAPVRGVLYCVSRSYAVRPGGWAFGVSDLETLRFEEPERGRSAS